MDELINHSIPNLFNGISQQSASIRQPSQAEAQENAYSSIVEGVHKRHPTNHIAKLSPDQIGAAYVHVINRDTTERYVVSITNNAIQVWDINGVQKTVNAPSGYGYLASAAPSTDFSVMTIADYTFIVNKTITTAMTAGAGPKATTEVQTFAKLPATGVGGTTYKITGDNTNSFGTYYVLWNGSTYVETTVLNTNTINPATMPYKLVREANGTFTFAQVTWKDRLVGDLLSTPEPSFIGHKLSDIFFYRNRMGFLSGENVIMSRAGDFFSFFGETATQVLDTDPIDVAVSHVKVSTLKHAIPFQRNLLLFSEQTQFVLAATDLLTPKTVTIHATTEFECSVKAKPTASGSNIYFPVDKSGYTGVREYYVANFQLTFDADDVTAHTPKYIPGNVTKLLSSTNEDVVIALSSSEPGSLYVYKYYWTGDEKSQSSWSRWTLKDGASILSADIMNTKLYLVVQRADGVYMESIDLQAGLIESDMPVLINLDRKTKITGSYNSTTNLTSWTVPYDETDLVFVQGGPFGTRAGDTTGATKVSPYVWQVMGDYSASYCYVGVPYTFRYRFSPQYFRDQNKVAVAECKLKLRHMRVFFTNSGFFSATVKPKGRDMSTYEWTGKQLGTDTMVIGAIQIGSGVFKFPVLSDSITTIIELTNDSHLPCFFQSAEWEGLVTSRSTRM